jgi:uncharacterized membrane protein YfcA
MYGYVALLLFLIPVGVLCWRVVVSKTRRQWLRIGGASAAMATLVGAVTIFPYVEDFNFREWRLDVGMVAASTGSLYLLAWSQRKHSNRRHRTFSIVAAIVGLIPIVSALATNLLFRD